MLGVYIVGLIVGGVLVLLNALGASQEHGGFDTGHDFSADHDVSVDHEIGADHDVGGHDALAHNGAHSAQDTWIPFLSLRFWTYFFAVGGAVGLVMTYLSGLQEPTVAVYAVPSGFLAGLVVSYSMRAIRRGEIDSSAREQDLIGKAALVTVALHDGQPGRIRCTVKGDIIDLLALPESTGDIPLNTEVVILGMEGQFAKIMPLDKALE